jgi:hypothetical protein
MIGDSSHRHTTLPRTHGKRHITVRQRAVPTENGVGSGCICTSQYTANSFMPPPRLHRKAKRDFIQRYSRLIRDNVTRLSNQPAAFIDVDPPP